MTKHKGNKIGQKLFRKVKLNIFQEVKFINNRLPQNTMLLIDCCLLNKCSFHSLTNLF